MDLSKIRAVIADDDVFRGLIYEKLLNQWCSEYRDSEKSGKLWEQIYHGEDKIDLNMQRSPKRRNKFVILPEEIDFCETE